MLLLYLWTKGDLNNLHNVIEQMIDRYRRLDVLY